jgi:hypothetical protein
MICSITGVPDALGDRRPVLILHNLALGLSKYEDQSIGSLHLVHKSYRAAASRWAQRRRDREIKMAAAAFERFGIPTDPKLSIRYSRDC